MIKRNSNQIFFISSIQDVYSVGSWRDNFYMTLTNATNLNIFPDNHPAEFRIQLNQNIVLDPDEWEVSLANIHYVHDFPNIGYSTYVKIRHRWEIYTLELPQWYCRKVEDLTKFISALINSFLKVLYEERSKKEAEQKENKGQKDTSDEKNEEEIPPWRYYQYDSKMFLGSSGTGMKQILYHESSFKDLKKLKPDKSAESMTIQSKTPPKFDWTEEAPKIDFSLDDLKRVKISFSSNDFDIAFSDDLLDVLGLYSEPDFSVNAFDSRTMFWSIIADEIEEDPKRSFYDVFMSNFNNYESLKKKYKKELPMLGKKSAMDLKFNLMAATGVRTTHKLFERFIYNFDADYEVFLTTGTSLSTIASDWPAKSEAEKYINPEEYRSFIAECEEADGLTNEERSFLKPDRGFSTHHSVYFTAFIFKKLLFGTLSNSTYISRTPSRINPYELLYIYTDLVKPDPFNEMMSRVLISFQTHGDDGKMVTYTPNPRQYKSLDKSNISNFKILIASDRGERIPFQRGPSVLTLHFRRKYFHRR